MPGLWAGVHAGEAKSGAISELRCGTIGSLYIHQGTMDAQQVVSTLKDLGLPAAISAALTVLVKALFDAQQRRSKESLLDWVGQASTLEPFSGDDTALRALH